MVVMAGVSLSHWPVSHTSTRSDFSSLPYSARKPGSDGEPHSSSPSISTDTAIGSSPATAFQARTASKKVMSWPLLSSAPRATITCAVGVSVAMRGSNGGEFHSVDAGPAAARRSGRRTAHAGRPRAAVPVVADDHGMPGGRHHAGVEADVAQFVPRTSRRRRGSSPCRRGRSTRFRCAGARTGAQAPPRWSRPGSSALGSAVRS